MIAPSLRLRKEVTSDEVLILDTPWSGGRSIHAFCGSVHAIAIVPDVPLDTRVDRVIAALAVVAQQMQSDAADRGANALCCSDCEIDPFWRGESTRIVATASALRVGEPKPMAPRPIA